MFQIAQNHITWITLVWTEAVYGSNSLACHWQKPLDFNEVVLDMYFYNFTLSISQIYHNFIVGLSSLVNATRENPLFPNLFLAFIKSRQPWFSWNVRTKRLFQKNTFCVPESDFNSFLKLIKIGYVPKHMVWIKMLILIYLILNIHKYLMYLDNSVPKVIFLQTPEFIG